MVAGIEAIYRLPAFQSLGILQALAWVIVRYFWKKFSAVVRVLFVGAESTHAVVGSDSFSDTVCVAVDQTGVDE